jgi:hypothetical protein
VADLTRGGATELLAQAETRIVNKYNAGFPDFFEMGSSMAGGAKMRDAA